MKKVYWLLGSLFLFASDFAFANEYVGQQMECRIFARQESISMRRKKLPFEDFFRLNLTYIDYSVDVRDYPVVKKASKYTPDKAVPRLSRPLIAKLNEPRVSVVSFNKSRQGNLYTFADVTLTSENTTNLLRHLGATTLDYEDKLPGIVFHMSGIENVWLESCFQTHLPVDRKDGLSFHLCSQCKVTREPDILQD